MAAYQPGEVVDIQIKGARVVHLTEEGVLSFTVGSELWCVPMAPDVTVERVAPAEWPPQPGDVWRAGGVEWFATHPRGGIRMVNPRGEDVEPEYVLRERPFLMYREAPAAPAALVAETATAPAEPRKWRLGDDIPTGVTSVVDSDGDTWKRRGVRWHHGDMVRETDRLLDDYGPVTEVLPRGGAS